MNKRALVFVVSISVALFFITRWFSSDGASQTAASSIQTENIQPPLTQEYPPSQTLVKDEQFYVIENEYQQLVFSNVGGALSEINLRLNDKSNPDSQVRPIRFDKTMAKDFPGNDRFPSHTYQVNEGQGIQTKQGRQGGYYPLLRRSLISAKGDVIKSSSPRYYALNVIDENASGSEQIYRIKRLEKNLIEFESEQSQRKVTKTFAFAKNATNTPYCIEVTVKIEGDARNLWLTSGVPEVELISGDPAPALKYLITKSNQKNKSSRYLSRNRACL